MPTEACLEGVHFGRSTRLRIAKTTREAQLRSFGFGLERLGLLVVHFPRVFAILLVASLVTCLAAIPSLRFDGNILNVLSGNSDAFLNYREVQRDFRDFSGDLGIIVRADDLYEPDGFERLRELHLELTLVDGIEGVFSLFTSSRIDPDTGALVPAIPERIAEGTDIRALVNEASIDNPLVAQLARPDANAALISVESRFSETNEVAPDPEPVRAFIADIMQVAPPGLQIDFVGYPLMRADAVDAVISDQVLLVAVGIAMVFVIAILTFRAIVPALICAMPALTAIVWVLGSYALAGAQVNYLSTALPTIAMVLALADTVMLYFAWVARRQDGMEAREAIAAAIRRVGPANAMTSITTAVAFGSFAFGGNPALRSLALLGSGAVFVAFVAVMVVAPVLLYFFGARASAVTGKPFFAPAGPIVSRFAHWRPLAISTVAVAAMAVFSIGHFTVSEQHKIVNQLPRDSQAANGERLAEDLFGGVAPIYLTLPVPAGTTWTDEAALRALGRAEDAFGEALGRDSVFSLARLLEAGLDADDIAAAMEEAPDNLRGRFISADRSRFLVTGTAPYGMQPETAMIAAYDVVEALEAQGISGGEVTGYPILAAIEIPAIVNDLRQSLILAIILGVGVVAVASRAPLVAAAAIAPNLIPVLFIESALAAIGQPMDIPHVIALTIAFGISIDNAIHVINAFLANTGQGMRDDEAMDAALQEVTPALISASLMFVAGSIGTVLSSLPSVVNLGFLIIATLSIALIANLAFLPALILTLRRLIGSRA